MERMSWSECQRKLRSNLRRADRNYCYANDVIVRAAVEAEVKIGSRKQLSFVWHEAHSVHAAR